MAQRKQVSSVSAPSRVNSGDGLHKLRDQLRKFAADREWDQFHSPKNLALLSQPDFDFERNRAGA